jgi:hypothetical protein
VIGREWVSATQIWFGNAHLGCRENKHNRIYLFLMKFCQNLFNFYCKQVCDGTSVNAGIPCCNSRLICTGHNASDFEKFSCNRHSCFWQRYIESLWTVWIRRVGKHYIENKFVGNSCISLPVSGLFSLKLPTCNWPRPMSSCKDAAWNRMRVKCICTPNSENCMKIPGKQI